jgi:hypothetical protein
VASILALSGDELGRAVRMTADVLDLISVEASLADYRLDEATSARLLRRRDEARARLDVTFALDLADRLGESVLREAMDNLRR